MTPEEIRSELKMTAPVFGAGRVGAGVLVKSDGRWREPGALAWCRMIDRDRPAEEKERVRRG